MIEKLLKYQEVDAGLYKLEQEIANSPARKKGIEAKGVLKSLDDNIARLENRATELSNAYENATSDLKKLKEEQSEYEKALDIAKDENSATYILKKVDELLGQIKNIANEAQRISNEIQAVLREYSAVMKNAKVAKKTYEESGLEYKELKESKKAEMEGLAKQLEGLKEGISDEVMAKYLKKRGEKVFPVLVELKENSCGYCGMELPMSEVSKLKNGELVECETCKKIVFKG